ncbi:hypothetical protein MTHERMOG20_19110 [Moorella thermoacetica]|uniref:Uncharacterized protein n=1 Tax=Moorella thermoacetica (strain ATCC 39073 / JCM 9320) TaxID=264732 RepID=Q2RLE3_MOOTA|nr:RusA family crossover junction endodeoxyribonuclease [Moorella thermoacetica]AKX93163.1 endodeoxyribonuclease RusA [Moorella thermoacetica]AKX95805.1 endodeoxyribonuclease RusA [Moorella thermoacetica]OIQ55892.1 endodeoxyribonuclease RusA [Moorella thermoacetica]QCZ99619.1 Endodeoxyribonuclease RusA [Moorella thermoacetica]TYL06679.1 hypothetical protein MOLA_25790 [Moorella thermoacetica]
MFTRNLQRWQLRAAGFFCVTAAEEEEVEPLCLPVSLVLSFATHPPGDLDNYIKSLADSLNGIAWLDDRQVARMEVEKVVVVEGDERAEVEVAPWKARF